jgi:hypothetical protein
MEVICTGLTIHHDRGSGAILHNMADKGCCCTGVNLRIGSLLTKHRVKIEIMMIHEHMDHISLHPPVVNYNFGAATGYNIVFLFLHFMREYRSLPHADAHFPSCRSRMRLVVVMINGALESISKSISTVSTPG